MAEDGKAGEEWRAPYVSYETLTNFVDKKLGAGNIVPPRIDRGFLDNYAGSVQPLIHQALRGMGLIDDERVTQPALRLAATGVAERKQVFGDWARAFYAEQIELAQQGATAQMLHESFTRRGYTGSTMRKAVVFYLALSTDVGLPTSPHFKPPRQNPVQNGTSRKPGGGRAGGGRSTASEPPAAPPPRESGAAERKTINFGSAGTVTIEVNVRWLDLPEETFIGLRKVVNDLAALERATSANPEPASAANEGGES